MMEKVVHAAIHENIHKLTHNLQINRYPLPIKKAH